MKKSEMIQEVASVIRDTFTLSDEQMAKVIVAKIEALGMLPPCQCVKDPDMCHLAIECCNLDWEKENA